MRVVHRARLPAAVRLAAAAVGDATAPGPVAKPPTLERLAARPRVQRLGTHRLRPERERGHFEHAAAAAQVVQHVMLVVAEDGRVTPLFQALQRLPARRASRTMHQLNARLLVEWHTIPEMAIPALEGAPRSLSAARRADGEVDSGAGVRQRALLPAE